MKIEEAINQTLLGKKIKLPEWGGYWFREDGILKVFCKNGDVVNTPNFPGFEHRTDWLTTEGYLGFDFSILAIKAGHKVRRRGWKEGRYIALFVTNEIHQFIEVNSVFDLAKTGLAWIPNQIDMMSEDWEKVAVL